MPVDKIPCPTCGRTVGVLKSGEVRRHKAPESMEWCAGGTAGRGVVIDIKAPREPRKHARMTADEKAAANAVRPPSKGLDRHGFGACGAQLRERDGTPTGEKCSNARGQGTDHVGFGRCQKHGGRSPTGRKHAALERARAEYARVKGAMTFYGHRVLVDPEQALLEEMQRTVGAVRWLEGQLADWGRFEQMSEELAELDPAPDADVDRVAAFLDHLTDRGRRIADNGLQYEQDTTGMPTLVAVHSTERALGFTDTEYAAWLKVYREERRHLAAVAKACIDANISERRQATLEARAEMIRSLVGHAMRLAGLTLEPAQMLPLIAEATRIVAKEIPA